MTSADARATAAKPQVAGHTHGPRTAATLLPRRPYPGLRPFEKAEWPIFRGRDRLIQDILTILAENHFVSIIGPSGSGKSSLVRAGVLATLERRHSRMGVRWRTGTMRPGASPLWSMADGILRALRPEIAAADGELPAAEIARLRVLIDASEDGLAAAARDAGLEEDENFLLLVDQFEEIFRYRADHEDLERTRLIEVLLAVANYKPSGIHIITTMRSEYLGDCARFRGLAETLNETHYLLPGMTEDELRQAIVEPAEIKNGRIEEGLVKRLIENIRGQEDQLPILQHTLLWMWIQEEERQQQRRPADDAAIRLGLADYEQLEAGRHSGQAENVKNALSRHGNRILEGMPPEERRVAEIMFRRMVEVEEHSNRLRRPTQCGTVANLAQVSLDAVQPVIDAFRAVDASFIFASRRRVTDDTSIDIMHESLIRQWDTLDRWVRREKASYEVYNDLCRAARRMRERAGTLLAGLALSRAQHWLHEEQPTRLWARRYGGDFDAAMRFLTDSEEAEEQRLRALNESEDAARRQEEEALRARLEEQTKLAQERRRHMRRFRALAVVGGVLTVLATGGLWYAHEQKVRADQAAVRAEQAASEALQQKARAEQAAIETNASSLWSRLQQLWRDPLTRDDVATLWDLTQQDEHVRIAFVRQLAEEHRLLRQFGYKPQTIARAVGLRWPADALQIAKRSMNYVASDQFAPTDPFELVSYTRALAALAPWLDPETAERARQNIQSAINDLAEKKPLGDPQLWALPETVEVFSARLEPPIAIESARDRLREVIRSALPPADASWRDHAVARAIQVMAPILNDQERRRAVDYVVPLLGQTPDLWSAKAIPRALIALLPSLEPGDLNDLPAAIASLAVNVDGDDSYMLALMQVTEKLGSMDGGNPLIAAFSQALTRQLEQPMDSVQRAALARATVPLLERQSESLPILVRTVAAVTLPHQDSPQQAEDVLRRALPGSNGPPERAQAALDLLHADWIAQPTSNASLNPYQRAAQARLLAMLAPSVTPGPAAVGAAEDLLTTLPDTAEYVSREAIARALAALAPKLPDSERERALAAVKIPLTKTGSSDEATAWARAIAALLPAEPRAATAEIVEALKYPTAAGVPSDVLVAALANVWPEEYKVIADKALPDRTVLDWLEAHLPVGERLTDRPQRPAGLKLAGAGLSSR
jgi:energy-coupling factor transporter ATP-binding protein EcfA2